MSGKKRKIPWYQNIWRLIKMKLVTPILRSPHPPEYKARGVAVGLAWSMTPLVGIQMWLVFMTWVSAKKIFKWDFSLVLGLAWTWVTNVFTLPPIYYGFYVTGQWMRGKSIGGYQNLSQLIEETFLSDLGFVEQWVLFFKLLLKDWGLSMAVGCIPWAILSYVLGYYLTLKFEQERLKRKEARRLKMEQEKNGSNI
ncbi:MAG: DUF2062 domain-containing protein [Lactobacillales bacterium]|nr:DUF2062 domain-containing protein [Lactobacillales bacterium]